MISLLSCIYQGEGTFQITEKGKLKEVTLTRGEYKLTDDAIKEFTLMHDGWELDVYQQNPHDPLIGGNLTL